MSILQYLPNRRFLLYLSVVPDAPEAPEMMA